MAESQNNDNSSLSREENISFSEPLGIKSPLAPSATLGQTFLSPQFISPLSGKSLANQQLLQLKPLESGEGLINESSSLLQIEGITPQSAVPETLTSEVLTTQSSPISNTSIFESSSSNLLQAFPQEESISSESEPATTSSTTEATSVNEAIVQASPEIESISSASEPTTTPSTTEATSVNEAIVQASPETESLSSESEPTTASSTTEATSVSEAIVQAAPETESLSSESEPTTASSGTESVSESESVIQASPEPEQVSASQGMEVNTTSSSVEAKGVQESQINLPSSSLEATSVNEAIVQASPEPESISDTSEAIPTLPTVLDNLVSTSPLGSSSPLVQESNFITPSSTVSSGATNIQAKSEKPTSSSSSFVKPFIPDQLNNSFSTIEPSSTVQEKSEIESSSSVDIPDSWSSIDELLGGNDISSAMNSIASPSIQKQSEEVTLQSPIIQKKADNSGNTNNGDNNYSGVSSTLVKEALIQMSSLETRESSNAEEEEVVLSSYNSGSSSAATGKNEQENQERNLEILAREIYTLIRQRLEMERERRGW